jgi:hypothetical protein
MKYGDCEACTDLEELDPPNQRSAGWPYRERASQRAALGTSSKAFWIILQTAGGMHRHAVVH